MILLAVIKGGDSGAYIVGRSIGRTKLAPAVSPGKTVEGLIGGFVVAIGISFFLAYLDLHPRLSLDAIGHVIGFAMVVTFAAVLGDLFESLIKRDAGCKDSNPRVPGFGGVYDMVDSVLIAAPVGYMYLGWVA